VRIWFPRGAHDPLGSLWDGFGAPVWSFRGQNLALALPSPVAMGAAVLAGTYFFLPENIFFGFQVANCRLHTYENSIVQRSLGWRWELLIYKLLGDGVWVWGTFFDGEHACRNIFFVYH